MHFIHRGTRAVLAGLAAAIVTTIPMASQAEAAPQLVEIVQKAKPNASGLEFVALRPVKDTGFVGASSRLSAGPFLAQKWLKTDSGQFSTYESALMPGMCLEVRSNLNEAPLMVGTCKPFLNSQKWTQGFDNTPFRKLQNLQSGRVATSAFTGTNITGNVVQRFDQGLLAQQWRVRAL